MSQQRFIKDKSQSAVSSSSGGLAVSVFISVSKQPSGKPLKMRLPLNSTVEDVIVIVLRQYAHEKRRPPLQPDSDWYELRMVDDEDDGTPDTDCPPLERRSMFQTFGVNFVALVEREIQQMDLPKVADPSDRRARGFSVAMHMNLRLKAAPDGRIFLKIYMPDSVSHIVPVTADTAVDAVLPLLAKKHSSQEAKELITPEVFKFVYHDGQAAVELNTLVGDLMSDELELVRRVRKADEMNRVPDTVDPIQVVFTHALAHQYTEFIVVKTNQRGKQQKRVLGIDGNQIYNRNPNSLNLMGQRIAIDVYRASRLISEVLSCEMKFDKRSFRIRFRDEEARDYEAETRVDCAQIVAKINFLLQEQRTARELAPRS